MNARRVGAWPDVTPPKSWPVYGSPEYYAADPFGKEKRFSVFHAAEKWRVGRLREQWLDELPPDEWYAEVFGDARRAAAQLIAATNRVRGFREIRDARAKPRQPWQLRATRGWPPIRIPGQPGRYLTYKQHQEAA